MSPARTNDHGLDIGRLVRQICLDVTLLKWFAVNGGRSLAVISAIEAARRTAEKDDVEVLTFLGKFVGGSDSPPPPPFVPDRGFDAE